MARIGDLVGFLHIFTAAFICYFMLGKGYLTGAGLEFPQGLEIGKNSLKPPVKPPSRPGPNLAKLKIRILFKKHV